MTPTASSIGANSLPCAILRTGDGAQIMLAIEARAGRGAVLPTPGDPLLWKCADGRLERVYIETSAPADRALLEREISGEGLLVAELPAGTPMTATAVLGAGPEFWILTPEGSLP